MNEGQVSQQAWRGNPLLLVESNDATQIKFTLLPQVMVATESPKWLKK
jgi:hypothetical protein